MKPVFPVLISPNDTCLTRRVFALVKCLFTLLAICYCIAGVAISAPVVGGTRTAEEVSLLEQIAAGNPHVLERFCDSAKNCFRVEQLVWGTRRIEAIRYITPDNTSDNVGLTAVHLVVPKVITPGYLNPAHWQPALLSEQIGLYNILQVAAGFMMESLSFAPPSTRPFRLLQVGLAGGSATAFLRQTGIPMDLDAVELEQTMFDVAKKWFAFKEQPNIRVHIEDGVKFIKDAAKNGQTYDSFMLDASDNKMKATINCPHEAFLEKNVMSDISKIVGRNGTFSANLFMTKDQLNLQMQVINRFAEHFKNCFGIRFNGLKQRLLVCSNREDWHWNKQRLRMLENLRTFDAKMNTTLYEQINKFNPPDFKV